MNETEMKIRTKSFALRVLKLIEALPETRSGRIVANQLGRSGTSVGANYRAVCRAKSTADMISKLSIVEEEADESAFWLELVPDAELLPAAKTESIAQGSRRTYRHYGGFAPDAPPKYSKIEIRKSKIPPVSPDEFPNLETGSECGRPFSHGT